MGDLKRARLQPCRMQHRIQTRAARRNYNGGWASRAGRSGCPYAVLPQALKRGCKWIYDGTAEAVLFHDSLTVHE